MTIQDNNKSSASKPIATIIIPAYNEEKGLPVVLNKLFKVIDSRYEVIVVDDGSKDNTSKITDSFPVKLIKHDINKGKGEAIITGAINAMSDSLIYIDADDTYPVATIPKIAEALSKYDMVIGSRKYGQQNIPRLNRLGNFFFRSSIRIIYGFKPYDPLNGLWGIKKGQLFRCKPTVRFAPDAEICIKAARLKMNMLDVPIIYTPRVGKTKLPPIKAGFEHVRLILSLILWRPNG